MEACTTDVPVMVEVPSVAILDVQPADSAGYTGIVRAGAVALIFSLAFSSSFVIGYFWLGPWVDAMRWSI
jgi:hypothetical protein